MHSSADLEWSKFARGPRSDNLFGEPVTQTTQVATTGSNGQPTGNTETVQRAVDSRILYRAYWVFHC